MSKSSSDKDQPRFDFEPDPALEAFIERRVAAKAKAQALYWRFRLITIETLMLGLLVGAAGLALHQPPFLVFRAAVMVSAGCFASGIILIGFTGSIDKGIVRLRQWWTGR